MRKKKWMKQFNSALKSEGMCKEDIKAVMSYYSEMYMDKRDDGLSEREAIAEFGDPRDVAYKLREEEDRLGRRTEFVQRPSRHAEDVEEIFSGRRRRKTRRRRRNILLTLLLLPVTLILGAIGLAIWLSIVLSGIAVSIAALAVIVAAFPFIAENIGLFMMLLGGGIVLAVIGNFICSLGGFLAKLWGKFLAWGLCGRRGGRR